MKTPRTISGGILRSATTWSVAFALWFGVLWWLSSRPSTIPPALQFTASDKLLHFAYFFIGGGLFSAACFLRRPKWSARRLVTTASIVVSLVGVLDEFHQSFVPLRSGNDPLDMLADALGSIAGSLAFLPWRRFMTKPVAPSMPNASDDDVTPPKGIPKAAIVFIVPSVTVLALLLTGTVKNFHIPTASMAPTLQPGDYLLCTRVFDRSEGFQRGQPVVFRPPTNPEAFFIQRIVAVGGDRVEVIDGHLAVNGRFPLSPEGLRPVPADPSHAAMIPGCRDIGLPLVVGPDEIFLLGDNYLNSLDSRYFGPVSADKVTHKPRCIVAPVDRWRRIE